MDCFRCGNKKIGTRRRRAIMIGRSVLVKSWRKWVCLGELQRDGARIVFQLASLCGIGFFHFSSAPKAAMAWSTAACDSFVKFTKSKDANSGLSYHLSTVDKLRGSTRAALHNCDHFPFERPQRIQQRLDVRPALA